MWKFKFGLWAVVLITSVFSFSACGDDDDNDTFVPPANIEVALKQLYPGAQNIEWEVKGIYYVADCWVNGSELDVWFDANANWIMTEMEIFREQLPAAVNTAYEESGYGDWVIDNLTKLTFPHKSEEFVFEVQRGAQERALYYSAYGGLLLEKDITDADDTHWPDVE